MDGKTEWSVLTEIIRPTEAQLKDEGEYVPADAQGTLVALGLEPGGTVSAAIHSRNMSGPTG